MTAKRRWRSDGTAGNGIAEEARVLAGPELGTKDRHRAVTTASIAAGLL
jgi:hypothetical protein